MVYSQSDLQLMKDIKAPEFVKFGEHIAVSRPELPQWQLDGVKEELKYQWQNPNAVRPSDDKVISEEELVAFLKQIDWHGKIICETYTYSNPIYNIYEDGILDKVIVV